MTKLMNRKVSGLPREILNSISVYRSSTQAFFFYKSVALGSNNVCKMYVVRSCFKYFKLNNNLLGYYLRIYCSKIQIKRILSKIERKA